MRFNQNDIGIYVPTHEIERGWSEEDADRFLKRRAPFSIPAWETPHPLEASVTIITSGFGGSAGGATSVNATAAGAVAVGDIIVAACGNDSGQTHSVSDTLSTSYTPATLNSTGSVREQFFYGTVTNAGTPTVTLTFGASAIEGSLRFYAMRPSGTATFDVEIATGVGISTAPATGNINTTGTDEIVFLSGFDENNAGASAQAINGTSVTATLTQRCGNLSYLAFGSTFTGQGTATLGASSRWAYNLLAFKITSGSVQQKGMLLGVG